MASNRQKIDFGAWEPDAPLLEGQQAPEACNVIPHKRGYKPLHALVAMQFPAVPSRVWEACTLKKTSNDLMVLAATENKIFSLENGAWVEKYSGANAHRARTLLAYGEDFYALFGHVLVKGAITGGTVGNFTAVEAAPAGDVLAIVRDFLVVGCLADHPNGIRWSGIDRPDEWPEPGSNAAQYVQSDIQIFPEGGKVQAIVGGFGGVDGLIFLEEAIQRATYVGTPFIFQFDPVDRARGCRAPKSPVICGNTCVYLATDGWRMTDGSSVKAIGVERIDEWFFRECSADRLEDVIGVHDDENRLAMWAFGTDAAQMGHYDRLLIYNYAVDKWSYGKIACETIFRDYARGLTLEDLDAYGPLDALPFYSLDAAALQNGRAGLSAFDLEHKLARCNGATQEAIIDTAEQGGQRMMLHGLRPLVDCGAAEALPIYRTLQMHPRRLGTYSQQQRDGICYQHLSTNYLAARVRIPAGENWHTALGVEALVELEGGL